MRTNKLKLVSWNADYYKTLSDDTCLVCLSERQRYLLGEMIRQIAWATRWMGDTSGLDLDAIAGSLEYGLANMDYCANLTEILNQITNLSTKIDQMQIDIDNLQSTSGMDADTPLSTVFDALKQSEDVFSDVSCDYDAIYGACYTLVEYINQVNVDFLEWLVQSSNAFNQADTLISAIPIFGALFPFDEAAEYAAFLISELLDEYNATVDTDLLQTVACDLFCLAVSNSPCGIDFANLINYFSSKSPTTVSAFISTFTDIVQFGLTGTMSGDEYFYYMCMFQLFTVYAGEKFFNLRGYENYANKAQSGLNNPSSDHELYCVECPDFFWRLDFIFDRGYEGWAIETGEYAGGNIAGIAQPHGSEDRTIVRAWYDFGVSTEVLRVKSTTYEEGHGGNGTYDWTNIAVFATGYPDTLSTQQNIINESFIAYNDEGIERCNAAIPNSGNGLTGTKLRISGECGARPEIGGRFDYQRMTVIGKGTLPKGAMIIYSVPTCEDI